MPFRPHLLFLITLLGCSLPPGPPPAEPEFNIRPTYAWATAPASSAGLDSVALSNHLKSNAGVSAILVLRDSIVVFEYYGAGFNGENDFDIRSSSKSFISALVGIAFSKGLLNSLDQPVLSFFPEFDTTGIDPRKRLITIRHLLTMRAGFDYDEGSDYSHLYTPTAQWAHVTLNLPLKFDPGSAFSYATPQTHLLAVILARASGTSAYGFAEASLFEPLGISVRNWYKDPNGYYYGGTGMSFTPRDFARLGFLYLRRGTIAGTALIPDSWIDASVEPRNQTGSTWGGLNSVNYGYQWWTGRTASDSLYMAAGYAGQFCFVIPQRSLLLVSTSDSNVPAGTANAQELFVIDFLVNHILPALN